LQISPGWNVQNWQKIHSFDSSASIHFDSSLETTEGALTCDVSNDCWVSSSRIYFSGLNEIFFFIIKKAKWRKVQYAQRLPVVRMA
jgi:hypothetical protein